MESIWHKLLEMFSNFWFKLLVEVIVLCLFLFLTWLIRKYLPKKWWISHRKLGNFIGNITTLSEFLPEVEDTASTLTKKSFSIIEFVYELGGYGQTKEKELIEYGKDLVEEVVARKDYFFMNSIFPLIESEAVSKDFCYKCTDDVLCGVFKFQFEMEINGAPKKINIYCIKSFSDYENILGGSTNSSFLCTTGVDHKLLTRLLYKKYGSRLYLAGSNDNKVAIQGIDADPGRENYLIDKQLYDYIQTDITKFRERKIQRSYLLFGPPGTGKSTFCLEATAKSGGTFVKLNKNFIENLEPSIAKHLLTYLSPSTIVVDDIDRITGTANMQLLLQVLEDVKTMPEMPVLMATANHLSSMDEAMLRPGRFDELIEFAAPNLDERKNFISFYLPKLGVVNAPESHIEQLAAATDGMTQAFLKEYCYIYVIENLEKALAKIAIRKKFLPKVRVSSTDEDMAGHRFMSDEDEYDDSDEDPDD